MRPRIGILVPADLPKGLPQGGELGFLYNLFPRFPLHVVVFGVDFDCEGKPEGAHSSHVEFQAVGKTSFPSRVPVRLKCLYWYARHRKRILNSGVDVLYVQQMEVALPFLFGRKRVPVVFHQHDVHNPASISRYPWGRLFPFRWFFELALRTILRRAQWSIVVDQRCLERAQRGGAGNRVTLIQNCVDAGKFHPSEQLRVQKREELGIDGRELVVVTSGRLEEVKRIDRALRALAVLGPADLCWRLLVAGEGSEREALGRLARELGVNARVSFLGHLPHQEMPALYNLADALLLPSRGEGSPLAVLEALACGTPVVATPVGAIPKIVQDGGNGFLLGDPTPPGVAAVIQRCLGRKWDRGELAKSVQDWRSESVAARIVDVLTAVWEENRQRELHVGAAEVSTDV
jgi:glycosyltransferase involved in cell wall biosynthesis